MSCGAAVRIKPKASCELRKRQHNLPSRGAATEPVSGFHGCEFIALFFRRTMSLLRSSVTFSEPDPGLADSPGLSSAAAPQLIGLFGKALEGNHSRADSRS